MKNWPFDPMPPLSYGAIMADCPWSFDNFSAKGEAKNAKAHYACMSLDDIKALPVSQLVQSDAYLWLWATNPMLPQALDVMKAWGFTYVTAGHWSKRGDSGKLAFGPGYVFRCAGEPYLIGKIGKPKPMSRSVRSVIEAPRREHSRKPDEAYEAFRQLTGDVRRADLFAREARPGFEPWGNEATLFDETPA
jgi:N6-adenosine-specific RNA methylase IME4